MTQKWQANKLSIDPLDIPVEVDFSSQTMHTTSLLMQVKGPQI